jgi:hypothetical protein
MTFSSISTAARHGEDGTEDAEGKAVERDPHDAAERFRPERRN